ncbi:hypothetical protein JHK84_035378 [Glycine max]|nr:hypothetical protein JHK84_035378 [Glycine max]
MPPTYDGGCDLVAWKEFGDGVVRFSEDGNLYSDHVLTSLVLSWAPLEMDWFKVNINRVIRRARMEAACGGVVGDHHGKFLIAKVVQLISNFGMVDHTYAFNCLGYQKGTIVMVKSRPKVNPFGDAKPREELYIHIGWPLYRKYGHAFEVTKVVPTVSEEVKDYVVKNTRRQMTPTLEN